MGASFTLYQSLMSLNVNVIPGILYVLNNWVPTDADGRTWVAAVGVGMPSSIPQTPYCAITMSDFDSPDGAGSDLEQTNWTIDLTLFLENAPDASNAEMRLAESIAPIRAAFNTHLKLNNPATVARARIVGGSWGYMLVNGIEYRTTTLRLSAVEKENVTYGA